ncbi:hypothetical protein HUB98_07915 [Paenibacillus barcinonensis]|uniref:MFS transporter n=1 Tax=Paenibacillus barcinonensis TaxID=198119 RepID=A0A2V4UZT0_PAEBA|nr:hypothetical protein [Paenibacillus barcinonensis]PYE45697.1 hypothetical protein DFQ00_11741 [Paenibacillus barcinonensis]QKS56274.1 hypothetical protein HUB98_07915 [Paenibacillus barcinonensis]
MNIAFYPFWAARTLFSLIQVISITTLTCLAYEQTGSVIYAVLLLCIYAAGHTVAKLLFPWLTKHFASSGLVLGMPIIKAVLLMGIALASSHLTEYAALIYISFISLSFVIRWESLLLEALQPQLIEENDLDKANNLVSFANYTVTGIGLIMTAITLLYAGIPLALWTAAILSFAALALISTVQHLLRNLSHSSLKLSPRHAHYK